jgi:hypothetical protein
MKLTILFYLYPLLNTQTLQRAVISAAVDSCENEGVMVNCTLGEPLMERTPISWQYLA